MALLREKPEEKIRVMHVITRMIRGGAQRIVLDLLKGQDGGAFEPVLVAGTKTGPEGTLWSEAGDLAVETVKVPFLVREISPVNDLKAFSALRSLIHRFRPHIVHAHTSKAGFLGCLAARTEGVGGIILAPHGHILGKKARIPGVPERGIKRKLLAAAARESSCHADIVVAPNESERRDGISFALWSEDNSVVIPNGVDTQRFRARDRGKCRKKLGTDENGVLIGVAARLTREKGMDYALQMVSKLPGAGLVVVGSGPERDRLKQLASLLDIEDRVHFAGVKTHMEEIIPAFDVCLVPSRTESHGMTASEAASCEVPVVASDVGGLRSVVCHGKTGLLVPPGDVRGYKKAVERILKDHALAEKLKAAGRRHMIRSFSTEVMLEKTTGLYNALLGKNGASGQAVPELPSREGSSTLHPYESSSQT